MAVHVGACWWHSKGHLEPDITETGLRMTTGVRPDGLQQSKYYTTERIKDQQLYQK